jgi:hypothetical protein
MDSSTGNARGADQHSHLLSLPGELRNMIYGYVLTNPKGLQYRRGSDYVGRLYNPTADAGAPHDADHETNQCQYVCHELRHETRGIGFRLNELYFKE